MNVQYSSKIIRIAVIKAKDIDTVVTGRDLQVIQSRLLKNKLTKRYLNLEKKCVNRSS